MIDREPWSLDMSDIHAGAFDWLVYDDPNATLGLDLNDSEPVPEPATFALLAVGLAMLWLRRATRRRAG